MLVVRVDDLEFGLVDVELAHQPPLAILAQRRRVAEIVGQVANSHGEDRDPRILLRFDHGKELERRQERPRGIEPAFRAFEAAAPIEVAQLHPVEAVVVGEIRTAAQRDAHARTAPRGEFCDDAVEIRRAARRHQDLLAILERAATLVLLQRRDREIEETIDGRDGFGRIGLVDRALIALDAGELDAVAMTEDRLKYRFALARAPRPSSTAGVADFEKYLKTQLAELRSTVA